MLRPQSSIIAIILVALTPSFAQTQPSPSTPSQPADCGVKTARTQADLLRAEKFFEQFRTVIEHDDRKSLAAMVRFPLRVNGKNTISNQATFLRLYSKIFDQNIRTAIRNQRTECIFGNWQGFMAGDGAVWFDYSTNNPKFKIIAVNSNSWPSKSK
jgi:hypothetical protein